MIDGGGVGEKAGNEIVQICAIKNTFNHNFKQTWITPIFYDEVALNELIHGGLHGQFMWTAHDLI